MWICPGVEAITLNGHSLTVRPSAQSPAEIEERVTQSSSHFPGSGGRGGWADGDSPCRPVPAETSPSRSHFVWSSPGSAPPSATLPQPWLLSLLLPCSPLGACHLPAWFHSWLCPLCLTGGGRAELIVFVPVCVPLPVQRWALTESESGVERPR